MKGPSFEPFEILVPTPLPLCLLVQLYSIISQFKYSLEGIEAETDSQQGVNPGSDRVQNLVPKGTLLDPIFSCVGEEKVRDKADQERGSSKNEGKLEQLSLKEQVKVGILATLSRPIIPVEV